MSRLHVDWTRCDGHGLCAELLPEMLVRDDWGYPVARHSWEIRPGLREHAEHARDACPLLALKIVASQPVRSATKTGI